MTPPGSQSPSSGVLGSPSTGPNNPLAQMPSGGNAAYALDPLGQGSQRRKEGPDTLSGLMWQPENATRSQYKEWLRQSGQSGGMRGGSGVGAPVLPQPAPKNTQSPQMVELLDMLSRVLGMQSGPQQRW